MKKYVCDVCGWVYDPEVGDPEGGIAPGTAFEDIPDDWVCPLCGVGKEDFSPVEEQALLGNHPKESLIRNYLKEKPHKGTIRRKSLVFRQ